MLEIKDLSLTLGKKRILSHINFSLNQNEILCILGKNGSGKSSLLKCILGIWDNYSGAVLVNGANMAHLSHRQRARRFAYLPQSCNIAFPFSLVEVVLMGRFASANLNYTKNDEKIALNAMDLLGIAKFKDAKFYNLSGGQKQLGLMARALAQNSDIMILDEPISALDMGACANLLRVIKKLGKTIILTSHRPEQCFIAHKVCLLKDGEILGFGESGEMLDSRNINALYGVDSGFVELPDKSKYFYVKQ